MCTRRIWLSYNMTFIPETSIVLIGRRPVPSNFCPDQNFSRLAMSGLAMFDYTWNMGTMIWYHAKIHKSFKIGHGFSYFFILLSTICNIKFILLYSLDSKPPAKVSPLCINVFLMDKSSDGNPFSKVSPRAYYPDYTVFEEPLSLLWWIKKSICEQG